MVGCKDDLDGLLEPAPIGPSKPVSRQPQRPRHSVPAVAPRAPNALRARTAASVRPGPAPCNAHRLRPLPESARAQETAESTEKQRVQRSRDAKTEDAKTEDAKAEEAKAEEAKAEEAWYKKEALRKWPELAIGEVMGVQSWRRLHALHSAREQGAPQPGACFEVRPPDG